MHFRHTALAAALIVVSSEAIAVKQTRSDFQAAVNSCQGALPSFEGTLRKRPLAIANEGTSTAFISCGLSSEVANSAGMSVVGALFINRGLASADVTCTLAVGIPAPFGTPVFFTKTATVPTGGSGGPTWVSADNGGNPFKVASISCSIPPGFEINNTQTVYETDVGA